MSHGLTMSAEESYLHAMPGNFAARPSNHSFELSDLDYDLPESLIAQTPAIRRTDARLLLVDRRKNEVRDDGISTLTESPVALPIDCGRLLGRGSTSDSTKTGHL